MVAIVRLHITLLRPVAHHLGDAEAADLRVVVEHACVVCGVLSVSKSQIGMEHIEADFLEQKEHPLPALIDCSVKALLGEGGEVSHGFSALND